jgi:Trk K+ transport system NAD-binding subunit
MRGHTIVCGLGQVGYRVANLLLALGADITVITEAARNEWMRDAIQRGVQVVIGDARDERLLEEAGLLEAASLIACTSSDVVNIEIALDAKRIRPDMTVVARLYDQTLARRMEATIGLDRAMAMSVIAAPAFAAAALGDHVTGEFQVGDARYFIVREQVREGSLLQGQTPTSLTENRGITTLFVERGDGCLEFDPDPDEPFAIGDRVELVGQVGNLGELGPYQPLPSKVSTAAERYFGALGRALNPLFFLRFIARVWTHTSVELRALFLTITALTIISVFVFRFGMNLAIEDALYFVVTTVTTTGYGDITPKDSALWLKLYGCMLMVLGSAALATLYSVITDYIVTARLQQLVGRQQVPSEGHVVLAGLGDVGYRTVEELLNMGARVVVVDLDSENRHVATLRSKVPVILGDAREPETLARAGVERANSLIAASGDDAVNLSICLAAGTMHPKMRRVLRVFDAGFASKIQGMLEIDAAMSASRIAAPSFVSASLHRGSLAGFVSHGHLFSVTAEDDGPAAGVHKFYARTDGGLTRNPEPGATPLFVVRARPLSRSV